MKPVCCDLCDLVFFEMYGEIGTKIMINGQEPDKFEKKGSEETILVKMNVCKKCVDNHSDLTEALKKKKEKINQIYKKIDNYKETKNTYFRRYWINFSRKFGEYKDENEIKL